MFKTFSRRFLSVAAIVALLAISSTTSAIGSSKPTLTVAVWSNWNFVQTAANAFMKHHNVSIQISAIPGDTYFQNLPRTLPNGGADITVLEVTGTGSYQALVKEHALANLNHIWNSLNLAKVTPKAVVKSYTSRGGVHDAVNIDETILPVVYYNTSLFKKLKIKAPSGHRATLAQFNTIVSKLRHANDIPMTYAWTTDAHHLFQQYLLSSCGKSMYYKLASSWKHGSKASWKTPCVVRAIAGERALGKKGVFGSNPIIGYDEASADFLAQKAGMFLTGMWAVPTLQAQAKFGWSWFLMPPPAGGAPTEWMLYSADGLGVNAHSKHATLAEQFLATMMTRKFQGSLLAQGRPPSRTDVKTPKGASKQLVQMVKSLKPLGAATHFIGILAPADFQTVVVNDSQKLLLGSISPSAFANDLQKLAQKLR